MTRTKAALEEMFKCNTYFSILDSKDMVFTHRSEEGDAKSFMLKRLKTAKYSRFSNQLDKNGSEYSSIKSSLVGILAKRNSSQGPIRFKFTDELENVNSFICHDEHEIGNLVPKYAPTGKMNLKFKTEIR